MEIIDTSQLLERLWRRPAENSDLIISLAAKNDARKNCTVYGLDQGGASGFVIREEFPYGICLTIKAPSPQSCKMLLQHIDIEGANTILVRSREISDWLSLETGLSVIGEYIHYAVDQARINPVSDSNNGVTLLAIQDIDTLLASVGESPRLRNPILSAADELAEGNSLIYIARSDEALTGYITISRHIHNLWEIGYIYVFPEARGRNWGKRLLFTASLNALDSGFIPLYTINATNEASRKTCEAVGYYPCIRRWSLARTSV
jgi:GNAT superfamily N-acetyltransferase